jgi:hypothetical protein
MRPIPLRWLPLIILVFISQLSFGQNDTLVFKSGEVLIGEIKNMQLGVLLIKTKYSDSDFQVEWKKVVRIHTRTQHLIHLSNGTKYHGRLESKGDSAVQIHTINIAPVFCKINEIVYLNAYKSKGLERFDISLSLGFDLTKARELATLSSWGGVGYKAEKWYANTSVSALASTQEGVEDIRRLSADLNYRYDLPKRWFTVASVSILSNSEQMLDMRWNSQLGLGNFLARTNSMFLGAKLGINRNVERYSNDDDDRDSWEGYFGNELSLFDIGDLKLYILALAYPSFTESNRWRFESKLDLKYDLPLDFFINLNISLNFDNQPPTDVSEFDYIVKTGFGWELD